jgi:ATP-dependent DNA helicase RecG
MTNEMPAKLDTPAQYLKGVGPKLAKLLKKLGVETIEDLIYFFPRDYEDRTKIKLIAELRPSDFEIIRGEVISINHQITRNRFSILKLVIYDRSGSIQAVMFNQPYLAKLFRKGMKLILSGKVEYSAYENVMQISVRDFEIDTGQNLKIVPRYPLTDGLYPKKMRTIVNTAVDNCSSELVDLLPKKIRIQHDLLELHEAVSNLHYPEDLKMVDPARRRLAFDEFFVFQLALGLRQFKVKVEKGICFSLDKEKLDSFISSLPFCLTSAQMRVLDEILSDMRSSHPMNRLLQGDVGSGKTIIATLAAMAAIQNGYQAAIMAPTEILAQQHYDKIVKLLDSQTVKLKLLTGTTQRKKKTEEIAGWEMAIGTHALIEEKVNFKKLGLVIIDEQHRFGVLQRAKLRQKGINPDILFMTATPIPRSLALTLYGDLDRSIIDEMPPGRTPIKTSYVPKKKRSNAYEFMRKQINEGRQIFIVCPLVEESEKLDLKAAMDEAEFLQKEIFPEFKVGLMHGRLKGEEKDKIMKLFKSRKLNILVSTTVIEVGIDIPNATVMVIEHAERFGLSQLHQLRGRIGRGKDQSYCFLMGDPKTQDARERIKAMVDSTDGFHIAEVDLRLRGPGDFYGVRQSGLPNFRVADIIRDEKILREARQAAFDLLKSDPKLEDEGNRLLKEAVLVQYGEFLGY